MSALTERRCTVPSEPLDAPRAEALWRLRLVRWWSRLGWDERRIPDALRADVEPGHHPARAVRGRADWERRL